MNPSCDNCRFKEDTVVLFDKESYLCKVDKGISHLFIGKNPKTGICERYVQKEDLRCVPCKPTQPECGSCEYAKERE